jgi:hypothetical protein
MALVIVGLKQKGTHTNKDLSMAQVSLRDGMSEVTWPLQECLRIQGVVGSLYKVNKCIQLLVPLIC